MDALKKRLDAILNRMSVMTWIETTPSLTVAKQELREAIAEADKLSVVLDAQLDPLLMALAKMRHTGLVLSAAAIALILAGVAIGINL